MQEKIEFLDFELKISSADPNDFETPRHTVLVDAFLY
jgi:hypothetical protein